MGYIPNYKFEGEDSLVSGDDTKFYKSYVSYNSKLDEIKHNQAMRFTGKSSRSGAKLAYEMFLDVNSFVKKIYYYLKTAVRYEGENSYEVVYIFRSMEDVDLFYKILTPRGVEGGWDYRRPFEDVVINEETNELDYAHVTVLCNGTLKQYPSYKYVNGGELDIERLKLQVKADFITRVNHDKLVYLDLSQHNELIKGFLHTRKFRDYLYTVFNGNESPEHIERLSNNIDFNDYLVKMGRIADSDEAFYSMLTQDEEWKYLLFSPMYVISKEFQQLLGAEHAEDKSLEERKRKIEGHEELNKIMSWSSTKIIPIEKTKASEIRLDNITLDDFQY